MTEREIRFLDTLCGSHEFLPAKEWMESHMPEMWEEYIGSFECMFNDPLFNSKFVNWFLNLSNLVAFLVEHKEGWGWVECLVQDECNRDIVCEHAVLKDYVCKIKHPALVAWEEEG